MKENETHLYIWRRCCVTADCQPGSSINPTDNTQCDPCVVGTYQTMKWQTSCIPCPSGSSTLNTGSMFLSDCSVMIDTTVSLIQFNITSLQFNPNYLVRTSSEFIQLKNQVETMVRNDLCNNFFCDTSLYEVGVCRKGSHLCILNCSKCFFCLDDQFAQVKNSQLPWNRSGYCFHVSYYCLGTLELLGDNLPLTIYNF